MIHAPLGGRSFDDLNCQYLAMLTYQLELVILLLTFNCEGETDEAVEHHFFAASIGMALFSSEVGTENIIKWAIIW